MISTYVMSTLAERLQWIVEHRGISRRQLSIDSGLSQSYVGQIIRGDKKGGVAPDALQKIAATGNVSLMWLITGKGSPEDTTIEPVHDEELSELDKALLYLGPFEPGLEAHLRERMELYAFSDGGRRSVLISTLEDEIAKWRRRDDPMPPKVKAPPATEVEVPEGMMRRKPRRG